MVLTEREYNQIKEESIQLLAKVYPDINVANLIRVKWVKLLDLPFFFIEIEEGM